MGDYPNNAIDDPASESPETRLLRLRERAEEALQNDLFDPVNKELISRLNAQERQQVVETAADLAERTLAVHMYGKPSGMTLEQAIKLGNKPGTKPDRASYWKQGKAAEYYPILASAQPESPVRGDRIDEFLESQSTRRKPFSKVLDEFSRCYTGPTERTMVSRLPVFMPDRSEGVRHPYVPNTDYEIICFGGAASEEFIYQGRKPGGRPGGYRISFLVPANTELSHLLDRTHEDPVQMHLAFLAAQTALCVISRDDRFPKHHTAEEIRGGANIPLGYHTLNGQYEFKYSFFDYRANEKLRKFVPSLLTYWEPSNGSPPQKRYLNPAAAENDDDMRLASQSIRETLKSIK